MKYGAQCGNDLNYNYRKIKILSKNAFYIVNGT